MQNEMQNKVGTPEHWFARADEARAMAANIVDPAARQAMLDIAASYEKIAKRAEAKEAGIPMHPNGHLSSDE